MVTLKDRLTQYWTVFRNWISAQWNRGNRGGAIISVLVVLYVVGWSLKVFWPYLLTMVILGGGIKLYTRYMQGTAKSPPGQVTQVSKPKIVTMPQTDTCRPVGGTPKNSAR